jgi:hypothetical protein
MTKQLTTKAVTSCGSDISEYPVAITRQGGHDIIAIVGTGKSWRLANVRDCGDVIALDFGSGWHCTNMRALVREAYAMINRAAMRSV